jgi:hypothetical protein
MSKVSLREQVVKRRPKGHSVDDKLAVVGEGQHDHFEELAIAARTDYQHLGRISVGVHVDDDQACSTAWSTSSAAMPCRLADR